MQDSHQSISAQFYHCSGCRGACAQSGGGWGCRWPPEAPCGWCVAAPPDPCLWGQSARGGPPGIPHRPSGSTWSGRQHRCKLVKLDHQHQGYSPYVGLFKGTLETFRHSVKVAIQDIRTVTIHTIIITINSSSISGISDKKPDGRVQPPVCGCSYYSPSSAAAAWSSPSSVSTASVTTYLMEVCSQRGMSSASSLWLQLLFTSSSAAAVAA